MLLLFPSDLFASGNIFFADENVLEGLIAEGFVKSRSPPKKKAKDKKSRCVKKKVNCLTKYLTYVYAHALTMR